jgi:hypothetical protein
LLLAGNKAEQLITISVKETNLSTSIVWNGIGDDNKINANEMPVSVVIENLSAFVPFML